MNLISLNISRQKSIDASKDIDYTFDTLKDLGEYTLACVIWKWEQLECCTRNSKIQRVFIDNIWKFIAYKNLYKVWLYFVIPSVCAGVKLWMVWQVSWCVAPAYYIRESATCTHHSPQNCYHPPYMILSASGECASPTWWQECDSLDFTCLATAIETQKMTTQGFQEHCTGRSPRPNYLLRQRPPSLPWLADSIIWLWDYSHFILSTLFTALFHIDAELWFMIFGMWHVRQLWP